MRLALLVAAVLAPILLTGQASAQKLRPADVDKLPSRLPTLTASYGSDANQVGDLRLPDGLRFGKGPYPVVIVVHGGCWWKGYATRQNTAALASRLTELGFATWNIDYRQVGDVGGGWPGTFQDWSAATDHLRVLARSQPLDLGRVGVTGHSAGAHAAMWIAARRRLPAGSEVSSSDPLPIHAVVAIDGPPDPTSDLAAFEKGCGVPAVTSLFGGTPAEQPARYALGTPQALLPTGVRTGLVSASIFLSPASGQGYVAAATRAGDSAALLTLQGTGHFEVIAPGSPVWPQVEAFLAETLKVPR
ncbi:alpha/beta hydrolase [Sandarakinorhabdus sp.]|uniref:alpha/beta hydrolase family protein n=1 Tax=Sandarakinorhabdus sp. TaxID=1916663 RepID=UPI00286DB30A|nr:alpha/beta hydrolase [Sandarakinorhabdus sp.]